MSALVAVVRKDLTLELRSGRSTVALGAMALLVLVVVVFAMDRRIVRGPEAAGGALWVAIVFGGMIGATSVVHAEMDNGCIRGLLLSPIDHATLYVAKLMASFMFMMVACTAAVVLTVLFFNLEFSLDLLRLVPILALGVLGFAALATLLATISGRARGGELLLPLLIVPMFVPPLVAGVRARARVLGGASLSAVSDWVGILIAFNILFVTAGYLLFEHVIKEG